MARATADAWRRLLCEPVQSSCVVRAMPGAKAIRNTSASPWSRPARSIRRPAPPHCTGGLLTTLPATTEAEAAEAVRLYRLRWRIEQTFRMLKRDGLQLEAVQTAEPHRLMNLAALATGAAVRIIQLVDARDGSARPASDVATEPQIITAAALRPTLEGATQRQRNHHSTGSLAWLSWIIARLGGWNCYGKPPGPKTMHAGWQRFTAIADGYTLAHTPAHDVCIP